MGSYDYELEVYEAGGKWHKLYARADIKPVISRAVNLSQAEPTALFRIIKSTPGRSHINNNHGYWRNGVQIETTDADMTPPAIRYQIEDMWRNSAVYSNRIPTWDRKNHFARATRTALVDFLKSFRSNDGSYFRVLENDQPIEYWYKGKTIDVSEIDAFLNWAQETLSAKAAFIVPETDHRDFKYLPKVALSNSDTGGIATFLNNVALDMELVADHAPEHSAKLQAAIALLKSAVEELQ